MNTTQSYSSKSTAVRGAKRAGYNADQIEVRANADGRFEWVIAEGYEDEGTNPTQAEADADEREAAFHVSPEAIMPTEGTPDDDALVDILTNGAKVESEDPAERDMLIHDEAHAANVETTTEDLPTPAVEVEGVDEKKPDTVKDMIAGEKAKAKQPTYKELANFSRSAVMKPVDFIHAFLDKNPHLSRKEAVSQLVQSGINFSTARTQYQRWYAKRKG